MLHNSNSKTMERDQSNDDSPAKIRVETEMHKDS